MSGALIGAGLALLGAVEQAALLRLPRMLYTTSAVIIPDCAIEETGRDDLEITQHPVEYGSVIADHAFKKPREVTLRWSWSNTGRYDTAMRDIYAQLLSIQNTRAPFNLYTGKCAYANMLIASLGQTTNSRSEYILESIMVCREVIIVSTQQVNVPGQSATAPPAQGTLTQTTAATNKQGTVQTNAITTNVLWNDTPNAIQYNPQPAVVGPAVS